MFLKCKKLQRFGASSFSKFHHMPKKSLCHPRTVLKQSKKSFCNRSQFRTLFLPHRFIKIRPSHQRPVSIEFVTICRFQDSPNLSKIEKVAETCEFHGKEPLFVERTIAISITVLGWTYAERLWLWQRFFPTVMVKIHFFRLRATYWGIWCVEEVGNHHGQD